MFDDFHYIVIGSSFSSATNRNTKEKKNGKYIRTFLTREFEISLLDRIKLLFLGKITYKSQIVSDEEIVDNLIQCSARGYLPLKENEEFIVSYKDKSIVVSEKINKKFDSYKDMKNYLLSKEFKRWKEDNCTDTLLPVIGYDMKNKSLKIGIADIGGIE